MRSMLRPGLFHRAVISAVVILGATSVAAQSYPGKPIRLIVPFPPGGGADIIARLVAPRLSERFGQQIVVDNRGGAGGTIGAELAARAAPDGYTLVLGSANLAVNVSLYHKLSFDPLKDFTAVTLLSATPNIVAVHPSLPVKSAKELIALARAKPGQINYASGGSGSTLHLAAELLKALAKINLVHVPYKGTGPALIAALGGEASLIVPPASTVLPQTKSGKLRALAITSVTRSATLPDLPTVAESGVPGYEASQWYGILVPAGTADDIVERLGTELVNVVQAPDMKSRLTSDASMPIGSTPQDFAAYLKEEIAKWAKVVKLSGARVE